MNGRKLFREYAQSEGKEVVEFVEIKQEFYSGDILQINNTYGKSTILDTPGIITFKVDYFESE